MCFAFFCVIKNSLREFSPGTYFSVSSGLGLFWWRKKFTSHILLAEEEGCSSLPSGQWFGCCYSASIHEICVQYFLLQRMCLLKSLPSVTIPQWGLQRKSEHSEVLEGEDDAQFASQTQLKTYMRILLTIFKRYLETVGAIVAYLGKESSLIYHLRNNQTCLILALLIDVLTRQRNQIVKNTDTCNILPYLQSPHWEAVLVNASKFLFSLAQAKVDII